MQWFEHTGHTKRYACTGLAAHVTAAYIECGVKLVTQRHVYIGVMTQCNGWVFSHFVL